MRQFLWIIHFRSFSHTNNSHNSFSGWVPRLCYAHLYILHWKYIHFNMLFQMLLLLLLQLQLYKLCSALFFFCFSAVRFNCGWVEASFSPHLWCSVCVCICVHILRFLVCGKEILLFLCVVVEYILLRVRIIYYRICNQCEEPYRARSFFPFYVYLERKRVQCQM